MSALLMATLWMAATAPAAAAGKLPAPVAKEMPDAVVAVNKALGLESWPLRGEKPCVDRGGEGSSTKNVSAEDTQKCAAAAMEKGFPGLGKSYVLAVLMASIGPATVIALGREAAAGWGAYSCDPGRACKPIKVGSPSKWGKRMADRQAKACTDPGTVWLPAGEKVCP
jgi:hypothetical protein